MAEKSLVGNIFKIFRELLAPSRVIEEKIIIPVIESKESSINTSFPPEPEVGETWVMKSNNPFIEDIYVKILEKKEGYIRYSIGLYESSKSLSDFMLVYRKV